MDKKQSRVPNKPKIPPLSNKQKDSNPQSTHVPQNAAPKQVHIEVKQIKMPNLKEMKSIDVSPALVFSKIPINEKEQDKTKQLVSSNIARSSNSNNNTRSTNTNNKKEIRNVPKNSQNNPKPNNPNNEDKTKTAVPMNEINSDKTKTALSPHIPSNLSNLSISSEKTMKQPNLILTINSSLDKDASKVSISDKQKTVSIKNILELSHKNQFDLQIQKLENSFSFSIAESQNINDNGLFKWEVDDVLLGKGTFGSVYKIYDPVKKEHFALKSIELQNDDLNFGLNSVLYEVFIMKKLNSINSPFVLKFFDCFQQKNETTTQIMIMMELCECSLNDIIEFRALNQIPYTEEELSYYFFTLLKTVFDFFELKITHRDIKPRNLLYNKNKLKLADFGEAKILDIDQKTSIHNSSKLSEMNSVRGTPNFMSPEIYNAFLEYSPSCTYNPFCADIYSLGLTFLSMKSLSVKTLRKDIRNVVDKFCGEENMSSKLIKCMLERDFEKRYAETLKIMKEMEEIEKTKKFKVCDEGKIISLIKEKENEEKDPVEQMKKMMLIAAMYKKLNKFGKAKEIFENILAKLPNHFKENDMEHLFFKYRAQSNIALIYSELGQPQKTIEILEQCHDELVNSGVGLLGQEVFQDEYGSILNELGNAYKKVRDDKKAITFYQKSLQIAIKLCGPTSQNTSVIYNNLGTLCLLQNNYKEAIDYLEKSLSILKTIKCDDYREFAKTYENLAQSYSSLRMHKQAEDYANKSLQLKIEKKGYDHPETAEALNTIGLLALDRKEFAKAAENFEKTLKIKRKFLGDQNIHLISTLNNLGIAYNSLGKDNEAKKVLEEGFKLCGMFGLKDEIWATNNFNLGNLEVKLGNFGEARVFFESAAKFWGDTEKYKQQCAFCWHNMGVISLKKEEDKNKTIECFEKSIGFYEAFLGKNELKREESYNKMKDFVKKYKK